MQTVADMRGVGVKNRGKLADVLCGRPLISAFEARAHYCPVPLERIRLRDFFD